MSEDSESVRISFLEDESSLTGSKLRVLMYVDVKAKAKFIDGSKVMQELPNIIKYAKMRLEDCSTGITCSFGTGTIGDRRGENEHPEIAEMKFRKY